MHRNDHLKLSTWKI